MVFITLAESREQQLVSEEEEEDGDGEEGVEEEMLVSDTTLWGLLKSRWTRVALPLAGLRARLEERNYIQVSIKRIGSIKKHTGHLTSNTSRLLHILKHMQVILPDTPYTKTS